jgi:hypothetical protein
MEIVKAIGEWLIPIAEAAGEWLVSTVNGLLGWAGFPVTLFTQLVVLFAAGFLVLLVVNGILKAREDYRKKKTQRELEAIPAKMTIDENVVFQNGLTPMLRYPVVFRLLDTDVGSEEDGETLGYIIQPSPEGENFFFFEGKWSKLSVIQSLNHLLIDQIEKEMLHGVKISEERTTPPGHFMWNGTIWQIERSLPFAVRVVEGDVYSFPGGKGAIELIVAIPYRKEEQENGAVVLEKQFNPLRMKRNETWTGYHIFEITQREVESKTSEYFEKLDLPN